MATREGIMLCYKFEEKRLHRYPKPWIVQPKLDGLRATYSHKEGLLSSSRATFESVPEIVKELRQLDIGNVSLDGELYCHNISFQSICSLVKRTTTLHEDREKINFTIFDTKEEVPQSARLIFINSLPQSKYIKILPSFECYNIDEVFNYLNKFIREGYEGIIIRNPQGIYRETRSTDIMKYKPTMSEVYTIEGHCQEYSIEGEPKDSLGSFICWTEEGEVFNVGSGFTKEEREVYWSIRSSLKGRKVNVKFQELTERGVPRFPVFLGIR
jgi:DNA ligase-1